MSWWDVAANWWPCVHRRSRAAAGFFQECAQSIEKVLRQLDVQIQDLERAIATMIENDDDWRGKTQLLQSVARRGAGGGQHAGGGIAGAGKSESRADRRAGGIGPLRS